jgi:methylmalonyl-CoA mutase C-terminal domain/subunit
MAELQRRGLDEALVIVGGTIPRADVPALKSLGVAEVFGPGTSLATIGDYIRKHAPSPALPW